MAITLNSLFPAKNQLDVPVASDVTLTLNSDASDLDVQTVKFYINGVEVKVSAYYGVDQTEIVLSFYAKRRIKYNTRRYGQDNVRYGQRDIFPSVFQYGYRYTCTVEVGDVLGNTFSENFSFTIEEGIFYNGNPSTSFYNPQTQAMANYTPEWARSRFDKYSNFQQFANPSANFLQEIEDSLFHQSSSYYVQTSNLNELGTLFKVELGGDFEFQTTILDDGTRLQIPPEVKAIQDITIYEPNAEYYNDLKNFYINKLPTRLDETKEKIDSLLIVPKTLASEAEIFLNYDLVREGSFALSIEDSLQFTQIINNEFRFLYCRIKGISRERKVQTEDLVIIDNDTYYPSRLWKRIDSIQFINLPENCNLNFSIDHARPLGAFVPDSYNHVTTGDIDKATFWKMKETNTGSILQQWVLLESTPEAIISSLGEKDLVTEFELLDIDGQTNLNLLDIDSFKFSNHIYGIDQEYLYVFDKREDYSTLVKMMPEINGTAGFILNIDSDELGRQAGTKTITISGVQKAPGKSIAQYRMSVRDPDGTVNYILSDNTLTQNKLIAGVVIPSEEFQLITSVFFYDMNMMGDYLVKLETVYKDGTSDIDTKIIRIHKKAALAKYKLERIFGETEIVRMFVDFDQQLKVLDSENELHTIRFAKDNMLIDYSNGLLYFSEEYDEVEV